MMRVKVRGAARAKERRDVDARRRAAMFWILCEAGASYGEIARAAGSPAVASSKSGRATRTNSTVGQSTSPARSH